MNKTAGMQAFTSQREARDNLRQQLVQYLERQPESTQALHGWMKRLEVASLGVAAALFIVALYVSINWTTVPATVIPTAWIIFAGSFSLTALLVGLHALILRAFPPVVLSGKLQRFVAGREAMWWGLGFMLLAVAVGAFFALFAYATLTVNWALLEPLIRVLGVVMGVGAVLSVVLALFQQITKSR